MLEELSPIRSDDPPDPPSQRNRFAGFVSLLVAGGVLVAAALWFSGGETILAPSTTSTLSRATTTTTLVTTTMPAVLEREKVLTTPTADGFVIADLTLTDGSRFMLQLPDSRGDGLTLAQPVPPGVDALVEGLNVRGLLRFDFCPGEAGYINPQGSVVIDRDPNRVTLCRPDQFTQITLESDQPFTRDETDLLHIIPVAYGSKFTESLIGAELLVEQCCFDEFGPIDVEGAILVSNGYQGGQVMALDRDTLVPLWTTKIGDASLLHGLTGFDVSDSVLIVSPQRGRVLGIDSSDGQHLWTIDLGDGFVVNVSSASDDLWLVAVSYDETRDQRAPELVAFNPNDGEVKWSARGFEGTGWQHTPTVITPETAILLDVAETAPASSVHAFDLITGQRRWVTRVGDRGIRFPPSDLMVADIGRDLLLVMTVDGDVVRLDPNNGAELWRTTTGFGTFTGLSPD
ncbi:MAG: PQQ-like beta-propeller repeat protein, partial [Acidimicrobiia bacterium]|nr:PQQ-like beta-propeller repeat protein [Acidimicrobiia bacterium]NNL29243.1 PQQ-binding-like beta-propeller repeat protein [Acidimicrobiia bacterium]